MKNETDSNLPAVPVLEPHEVDAIFAILARVIRCDRKTKVAREKISELQAEVDQTLAERAKLIAVVNAFGFESSVPGLWDRVKEAIGNDRYSDAFHVVFTERQEALDNVVSDDSKNEGDASVEANQSSTINDEIKVLHQNSPPNINSAILSYLRNVYPKGAQVAEIKKHLSDVYKIETHEKTPGMTLYRLSKNGLVRREGRTWFATESNSTDLDAVENENANSFSST